MSFIKGKKPKLNLVFPNLIYKILSAQRELILDNESIEPPNVGQTFKISEKPSQGKSSKKSGRSASPGVLDASPAATASTSAPAELAEINARLARMENSQ